MPTEKQALGFKVAAELLVDLLRAGADEDVPSPLGPLPSVAKRAREAVAGLLPALVEAAVAQRLEAAVVARLAPLQAELDALRAAVMAQAEQLAQQLAAERSGSADALERATQALLAQARELPVRVTDTELINAGDAPALITPRQVRMIAQREIGIALAQRGGPVERAVRQRYSVEAGNGA